MTTQFPTSVWHGTLPRCARFLTCLAAMDRGRRTNSSKQAAKLALARMKAIKDGKAKASDMYEVRGCTGATSTALRLPGLTLVAARANFPFSGVVVVFWRTGGGGAVAV